MHISSQSKANGVNHILSNKANTKHSNEKDHNGQHKSVNRPAQIKQMDEPQEHKCHEEILSVHIDDTQKSTYNAKVSSMEATALFDSGTTLSCISKHFYDHIHHIKPSMVINTSAGPAIVVTSASDDELINLGWCRLCIKLGKKMFEYYFQILKNLKWDLILGINFQRTFKISQDITDDNDLYLHIRRKIVTFSQQAKNTTNHIKKIVYLVSFVHCFTCVDYIENYSIVTLPSALVLWEGFVKSFINNKSVLNRSGWYHVW